MQLRDYQQAAIDSVRQSISRQRAEGRVPSLILTSPTGSGKTAMASFMAHQHVAKGGVVYFLCHRKELIDQTSGTFDRVGLRHSFVASGYNYTRRMPVQICSVNTLVGRLADVPAPTLAIWDECHHVGAATWARIREAWGKTIHVGLTATPQRLDGKGLGAWFNELVAGPSVSELIEQGHLSNYEVYAPVTVGSFHKRAGEYIKSEMESALGTGEIMGGVVDHWRRLASGRKTIGFAISVKHSVSLVEQFQSAGIKAAHLDAQSAPWARRAILQSFARGDIEVLFNVDLFGEGFDLAANSGMDCNVEAVILARPTASLGLHLQQVGRALRPKPNPAIILDHAGNTLRHGFPDDIREWTLDGDEEQKPEAPKTKTCPACFYVCKNFVVRCPACGYDFTANRVGRKVEEVEGELTKLERTPAERRAAEIAAARDRHLASLKRIELVRGLPSGWAEKTFTAWESSRSSRSKNRQPA